MYTHQGYNSARIAPIMSYREAQERYKETQPIRGRLPEVRPLGKNRRYTDRTIQEKVISIDTANDGGLGTFAKSYVADLWNHHKIEFMPNEEIILTSSNWRSATVMGFYTFVLGGRLSLYSHSGKWYIKNRMGQSYPFSKNMHFKPTTDINSLELVDAKPEYKYQADRKALNAVKRRYKSFFDYARTMFAMETRAEFGEAAVDSLLGKGKKLMTRSLLGNWHTDQLRDNRIAFFDVLNSAMRTNDLDKFFLLAQYAGTVFGSWHYRQTSVSCTPQEFEKGWTQLLKYHFAHEVFKAVEQPIGIAFHDRNARYFSQ
jgi:hypothetical protein